MIINELRDFIYENCYSQIRFPKEDIYYSMKHQKKNELLLLEAKLIETIPDATNAELN